MRIIVSEKEKEIMESLLTNIFDQPLKETPGILSIKYKMSAEKDAELQTIIEVNEKYVTTMYGEVNKWLPPIISVIKGLIAQVKSVINRLSEIEMSLFKELNDNK